jgi:hypothetical protein
MNTVSVNGLSCSYARLGKYSNCATQEKAAAPVKTENFDPSPTTLPTPTPTAVNYTPSYTVPNYAPIKTTALVYTGNSCSGYPNIMDAYGKDAGNCVTNYINI